MWGGCSTAADLRPHLVCRPRCTACCRMGALSSYRCVGERGPSGHVSDAFGASLCRAAVRVALRHTAVYSLTGGGCGVWLCWSSSLTFILPHRVSICVCCRCMKTTGWVLGLWLRRCSPMCPSPALHASGSGVMAAHRNGMHQTISSPGTAIGLLGFLRPAAHASPAQPRPTALTALVLQMRAHWHLPDCLAPHRPPAHTLGSVPPPHTPQPAADGEPDSFYACKWSKDPDTGVPLLLLAGERGVALVIDVATGSLVFVSAPHSNPFLLYAHSPSISLWAFTGVSFVLLPSRKA